MITTLDDFICEFRKIREMGWIPTHRTGSTGIGKTLEDRLGIIENNLDAPDFGEYELKSARLNSNSMLTIFTRAPQPAKANTFLRQKYGYSSSAYDNDEKVIHSTLNAVSFTPISDTGYKLKVQCAGERIYIANEKEIEKVYWDKESLRKAFNKKYTNKFVYVKAESRNDNKIEEFHFISAYIVSDFDYDGFLSLLEQGKIYVDLRIGQYHSGKNAGKTHDHGTGFRIRERDQVLLFKNKEQIG
ncbi:MAG: MvaI/BcnI family restriction endonuclease [Oscillospiraceae bacterium]|nr:MvaI/BcnI family restriction endonuclease [Oscillospiraceae bacterium]